MRRFKRYINMRFSSASRVLSLLIVMLMLSGCGNEAAVKLTKKYSLPKTQAVLSSGEVAENPNYSMYWDDTYKSVTITEKSSGKKWSTIPYDTKKQEVGGYARVNLHSPITIWYIEENGNQIKSMGGFQGSINKETVSCEKTENGIRVTYYFDTLSISVPVEYVLEPDGFLARIPIKDIEENENLVYSISLLPFFVATENSKDSYLFVPSGSGALIYTDAESKSWGTYSESVYGDDAITTVYADVSSDYGIKLPIYGVKDSLNKKGCLAVITSGAESAKIEAQAADTEIGYSSSYATFLLRGYDYVTISDISGKGSNVEKYSDSIVDIDYFAVKYLLISDEKNTDYNGMAHIYRDYLIKNGQLKESQTESNYYFNILGGARVQEMFLGIPYNTTASATTLNVAYEIIKEAEEKCGKMPSVQLKGFGDYGLDIGKIAGGFDISSEFGSNKDLKKITEYVENGGAELYMDFDVLRFSSSSSGASTMFDAAATANFTSGMTGGYDAASNKMREDYPEVGFIKRSKLLSVVEKLTDKAHKLSIKGISLGSLSNIAYSDYSSNGYVVKTGMSKDAIKGFETVKNAGFKTASSMANLYVAGISNAIFGTPHSSSKYDILDIDIPFYQMVFKGYVPIYSSEINLSSNQRKYFLEALKTGQGLGFSVCGDYEMDFITGENSALAGSVWKDVKADIYSMVKESAEFLDDVQKESVVGYEILDKNFSRTEFSNGTVVYVNTSDTAKDTPFGQVEGNDFLYGKEDKD